MMVALVVGAGAVYVAVLMRFGLLASMVMLGVMRLIHNSPITLDLSAWYVGSGFAGLFVLLLLLAYGFKTSLDGRRVFELADV